MRMSWSVDAVHWVGGALEFRITDSGGSDSAAGAAGELSPAADRWRWLSEVSIKLLLRKVNVPSSGFVRVDTFQFLVRTSTLFGRVPPVGLEQIASGRVPPVGPGECFFLKSRVAASWFGCQLVVR